MENDQKTWCKNKSHLGKWRVVLVVGVVFSVFVTVLVHAKAAVHNQDESRCEMIIVLFRHGEKSPGNFYPNDPHAQLSFYGGAGSLTMRGSLQAYNLGSRIKYQYYQLVPLGYSEKLIQALSSYAERCIMSAQAFLAGMLPVPLDEDEELLPIPWQPATVTSIPRLHDTLLAQKKPCASYEAMLKEVYTNPPPDMKELNEANRELYTKLSKFAGKNISTVADVELLYSTLKAEEEFGLELPAWTHEVYPEQMLPLVKRSYTVFTENDRMKRIKGGGFLNEIHRLMANKANKTLKPDRKVFIFSGHDVTLVNVMNSMGILHQTAELPEYASALVFELHNHTSVGEPFEVRMRYFANSDVISPTRIAIRGCPAPCALEDFTESIKHLLFDDYDEICDNSKKC